MRVQVKDSALSGGANTAHAHEFLLVCDDPAVVTSVVAAVETVKGRLNCTEKLSSACDYVARRKVDGIVLDMELPGALDLLRRVRSGNANRGSVIFACMGETDDSQAAIRAGANFVLQRPLDAERIAHAFRSAEELMVADQRRYFRYPLMVPVELKMRGRRVESTMSNLSEGGMAIWSLYYHTPGSPIHFAFEIPFGGVIRGEGEVAWTNADGLAGIRFQVLPEQAHAHLSDWISRRGGNEVSS